MALENRLTQEQALIQQQQQRLTAQQILQVKLLEMPLAQLEENIKTELYENPALESANPDESDNLNPNASLNESDSIGDGEEEDFDTQTEREDREEALDSALDSIDSDDRLASDYRAGCRARGNGVWRYGFLLRQANGAGQRGGSYEYPAPDNGVSDWLSRQ